MIKLKMIKLAKRFRKFCQRMNYRKCSKVLRRKQILIEIIRSSFLIKVTVRFALSSWLSIADFIIEFWSQFTQKLKLWFLYSSLRYPWLWLFFSKQDLSSKTKISSQIWTIHWVELFPPSPLTARFFYDAF